MKDDMIDDNDDGDEEEVEDEMDEQTKNEMLLKACKENNHEEVEYYLSIHASPTCQDKDGWTPLLWAACNGNEQIVRILIKYNACAQYTNQQQ